MAESTTCSRTRNIQAHSGNLITITFCGLTVGVIQSMTTQDDFAPDPLSGIGDIHVQEWVPTMARHTIQVQRAVLRNGESLYAMGIQDENGCMRLTGMEFDINIHQRDPTGLPGGSANQGSCSSQSGDAVRTYKFCTLASASTQIQAHKIIMTDATFYARDVIGKWGLSGTNVDNNIN